MKGTLLSPVAHLLGTAHVPPWYGWSCMLLAGEDCQGANMRFPQVNEMTAGDFSYGIDRPK